MASTQLCTSDNIQVRKSNLETDIMFFVLGRDQYSFLKSKDQGNAHLHLMSELNSLLFPVKKMRLRYEGYVQKNLKATFLSSV